MNARLSFRPKLADVWKKYSLPILLQDLAPGRARELPGLPAAELRDPLVEK